MVDINYALYSDIAFLYIFGLLSRLDFIEFLPFTLSNPYSMVDMKLRHISFSFLIREKPIYLIVVAHQYEETVGVMANHS